MKRLILTCVLLALTIPVTAQSVFVEQQQVRVLWHGRYRAAEMKDNPRMTDQWTVVRIIGGRRLFETVPLLDVRARRTR